MPQIWNLQQSNRIEASCVVLDTGHDVSSKNSFNLFAKARYCRPPTRKVAASNGYPCTYLGGITKNILT